MAPKLCKTPRSPASVTTIAPNPLTAKPEPKPRMEPDTEFVVCDPSINWVWYRKYKVCKPLYNGETSWLLPLGEGYLLHKFDDRQGADRHPTDTVSAYRANRPDYGTIKAFGMDVIARWEERCKRLGVHSHDCAQTMTIDGNEYPVRTWMDKK